MVYRHHRPLTGMYEDNYRYGSSLSSPSVGDVERRYRTTLSRTHLRSDRGDLGMYSFAGSNLHGGTPAADKGIGVKTSGVNQDLYAPLKAAEYGSGYYDHLRARSPEPRARRSNLDPYGYLDEPIKTSIPDFRTSYPEYKTTPSKITTDFSYDMGGSDRKNTTTKTTITEQWVPLTTYIYNTPYHTYYYKSSPYCSYTYRTADDLYSYNYLDDYKRYSSSSTTTKSKNIDALDLSISSKNIQQDYSHYSEKCQEIQSQLDEVNKWVYEAEMKIKNDVASTRSKLQSELADVCMIVEDTARYNEDLYRAIKKQAKQISTLNSQFDEVNHHVSEISDTLEKSRLRCQTLQSELSNLQSGLQVKKTTTKRYILM